MRRALVFFGFLFSVSFWPQGPASAHEVGMMLHVVAGEVEGRILERGSDHPEAGIKVLVSRSDGLRVANAVTDAAGRFRFTPKHRVDHVFMADLGMGHVATKVLPFEDLPETLTPAGTSLAAEGAVALLVEKAVAAQVVPLRRDIAAFSKEVRFHDVLGGIGYVLGLFGIAGWVAARRRDKAGASR